MDLIIKKVWTKDKNYHITGFIDKAEFYIVILSNKIISNPQQLSEEQIQEITFNLYELQNKIIYSAIQ